MDFAAFSPASTASFCVLRLLDAKHGIGRGAFSVLPLLPICTDPPAQGSPQPVPRKMPVCDLLISQWVKALETRSLPRARVPGLLWIDASSVQPSQFGGKHFSASPLPCGILFSRSAPCPCPASLWSSAKRESCLLLTSGSLNPLGLMAEELCAVHKWI